MRALRKSLGGIQPTLGPQSNLVPEWELGFGLRTSHPNVSKKGARFEKRAKFDS